MRTRLVALVTAALGLVAAATPGGTPPTPVGQWAGTPVTRVDRVTHQVVGSFDGAPLFTTLFMPAQAAGHPAPLVMRGHGWGGHGERTLDEASSTTRKLLAAGYAVLTWDERGFGWSGGKVHLLKPDIEGKDVTALVDWVATTPGVARHIVCEVPRRPDGTCPDPVIGMTGASYGGAIQLAAAAADPGETVTGGREPRIDALAPEITWHDLREALYAGRVVNRAWGGLLYAAGMPTARGEGLDPRNPAGPQRGGLAREIHQAQAEATATNQLSERSVGFFGDSSLAVYGRTHPIAVPTLLMQGTVDTLFDLTEAVRTFRRLRARNTPARLIAFCGGHVPCPDSYPDADDRARLDAAILDWFARHLRGQAVDTGPPVVYRTNRGGWRPAGAFPPADVATVTASGRGSLVSSPAPTTAEVDGQAPRTALTTARPSPPADPHALTVEVTEATGRPRELVGIPRAHLTVTGRGPAAHLFVKLVDREADEVVNLQETPVRVENLSRAPQTLALDLSAVAYTLPAGHHLDVQVATTSLMHATARTPARVEVGVTVAVPVRDPGSIRVAARRAGGSPAGAPR